MMRSYFTLLILFASYSLIAASGDKTMVDVHQATDLVWHESYDQWAMFPDNSKNYQNITLELTIGCASTGCSNWDYDTDVFIGRPTGNLDSNITGYDTLSMSPLILDTLWNVFEIIDWHNLGRMITPYGTYMAANQQGFTNAWTHKYTYDVTDFEPLLHDSIPVRVRYNGWSSGFSATVRFIFTEGNPTRDVLDVMQIYRGGGYSDFATFDAARTPSTNLNLPSNVEAARLKVIVTGHGQDGEFTPINYTVKSNGNTVRVEEIWRDDCGIVSPQPQGGTWIFNRANWCPGDAVEVHDFELTPYLSGGPGNPKFLNIDIDFDSYTPSNGASYSLEVQLITYSYERRLYDVMLDKIIAPSQDENFEIFNPICDRPRVRIRNYGLEDLTYCQIAYWVDPNNKRYFDWTGNLKHGESEDVWLDVMDWTNMNTTTPEFTAEVSWPNNYVDQFEHNNTLVSEFVAPTLHTTNSFQVRFVSNNRPTENWYLIKDINGDTVMFENSFPASSTNTEFIHLVDGCYTFEMHDYDPQWGGGDGISWWFNLNQGLETTGSLQLRDSVTNFVLENFQADFGSKIHYPFLVNTSMENLPGLPASSPSWHPDITIVEVNGTTYSQIYDTVYINEDRVVFESVLSVPEVGINELALNLYPNPTDNQINLIWYAENYEEANVQVFDALGVMIKEFTLESNLLKKIDFTGHPTGVYLINVSNQQGSTTKSVLLSR